METVFASVKLRKQTKTAPHRSFENIITFWGTEVFKTDVDRNRKHKIFSRLKRLPFVLNKWHLSRARSKKAKTPLTEPK